MESNKFDFKGSDTSLLKKLPFPENHYLNKNAKNGGVYGL